MSDEARCATGVQPPAHPMVPRRVVLERAGALLALGTAAALRRDAAHGLARLVPWLEQHKDNPTLDLAPAPETPL